MPTTQFDGRTEQQRYDATVAIMYAMTYEGKLINATEWDGRDRRTGGSRNG